MSEGLFHNKPVFCFNGGRDKHHISLLKDSGLLYNNSVELYDMLLNVKTYHDYNSCVQMISTLLELMEGRYHAMASGKSLLFRPQLVIIDEFADLIMQDHNHILYNNLCKLAQKCRAAKIHIILSTQRPSVNIINGEIKANFPARIACKVSSYVDSKIILDTSGAENLLGKGDALIKDSYRTCERFQVANITPSEIINHFASN